MEKRTTLTYFIEHFMSPSDQHPRVLASKFMSTGNAVIAFPRNELMFNQSQPDIALQGLLHDLWQQSQRIVDFGLGSESCLLFLAYYYQFSSAVCENLFMFNEARDALLNYKITALSSIPCYYEGKYLWKQGTLHATTLQDKPRLLELYCICRLALVVAATVFPTSKFQQSYKPGKFQP